MDLTLSQIAHALGGEVRGNQVLAPGPGHSSKDRSLSIKLDPNAPGGIRSATIRSTAKTMCARNVGSNHLSPTASPTDWQRLSLVIPTLMSVGRHCLSSIDMTPKASANGDLMETAGGNSH
jgi:hypothetical protein